MEGGPGGLELLQLCRGGSAAAELAAAAVSGAWSHAMRFYSSSALTITSEVLVDCM